MKNTFSRGALNEDVQKLSKDFLGRDLSLNELRLFPYIDYCLKNFGRYDPLKMNKKEIQIFHKYAEKYPQHFAFSIREIAISKEFYQFIQDVLWISFVGNKLSEASVSSGRIHEICE